MAAISDLRMRPHMRHAYLFLVDGVPFGFTDEPEIAHGSGWWTLDDRRILLGLTVPSTLKVSLDLETGLLDDDAASFQLLDLDGTVPQFFGGLQKSTSELGPRLHPLEDPAPDLFDGDGGALSNEGCFIGTEALGPEGQRGYYSAIPWANLPGQDHPGYDLPRPVHTTHEVGPYLVEGRRVALYRLIYDPDTETWIPFGTFIGSAQSGGWSPMIWWGQLRQAGRVEGRTWTISCVGPGSWLKRNLNSRTTTKWYPVTVDLELEDSQRTVFITFSKSEHNGFDYQFGQDFDSYSIPDGTPADIAAYLSNAIEEVSELAGDVGIWTTDEPPCSITFDATGCIIQTLASVGFAGMMSLRLHRKVWKALGYDPDFDPEGLEGPQPYFLQNPKGYHTGYFSTVGSGYHPFIQDPSPEWDGDGIPRVYAPLYQGGVSILSGAGGEVVRLSSGEEGAIYCESQTIRPKTTSFINSSLTNATRLWAFRGKLQLPGQEEPEDVTQVALCSWVENEPGLVAKDESGITHGLAIDAWLDPRLFGYHNPPIDKALGWASVDSSEEGATIECSPIAMFGSFYRRPDRVDHTIIRTLVSTGTAYWDEAATEADCSDSNVGAYVVGNLTPGQNDYGSQFYPCGDFEIFDLGLQIPKFMVNAAAIIDAASDLPGGETGPLGVGKVAVQGGPINSADLFKALLAPRGWVFSLIRGQYGVWAPHRAPEEKFNEATDPEITESDLHGVAGDPASTIPSVEMRPVNPFDLLTASYTGNPSETWQEGQNEQKQKARDPGSRARSGARTREVACPDLISTEWWVDDPNPNNPNNADVSKLQTWQGDFTALWERQIPSWLAQPHRKLEGLRISRPKGQDLYPGQIIKISNPWPANSTGTYGFFGSFARVVSVQHETDSCACVCEVLVDATPTGLRWAPIVRVLDDADEPEDRYDPSSRTFYLQDWGGQPPPLRYFLKPGYVDAPDEPALVWGLQYDGASWTHTFSGFVDGINTIAKSLALTDDGLEGSFYKRMYTCIVLAPADHPDQVAWVSALYPQHTGLPASGLLKKLPL